MRILVTGGTGFTGTALVRRLIQEGHDVVALDYKEGLQCDALRAMGATVHIGTVTDAEAVDRCMAGVEVVHHLAAAFRELNVPEQYYYDVNVNGTRTVLDAAVNHGVKRFIYCSTCGVHGNVARPPAGEDAPITPADYYQRTKYEAEPIVLEYHRRGLPCVILRPAAIYGPGDPERFFMIFKRAKTGTFPMFGNGRTLYHPLYVDNLVDAFLLVQQPGVGDGKAYLIADEEYWPIEEIVIRVGRALGRPLAIKHYPVMPLVIAGHIFETICKPFKITPPIFPRRVDWYRQNRAFDISRAKREIGYRPAIGLDEGLKRTAAWYREKGYL
ncbi:MAG: NAD-dependent epimerase/dehydratase family protein [Candidatus Eisenbacteria bacterium]|nr:NAD-dependent epimerase/dehydratase family protein [Candidatus Eisenbacteria bacterium]